MAHHQIDFHVTLWSDDKEELLLAEQMFKQFETNNNNVGGSNSTKRLHALSLILGRIALSEVVSQTDIHSVDINWDDEGFEDSLEKAGMLYLGEFDEAEAERIRNLLHNADEQTAWGRVMYDQIMEGLSQSSDDTPAAIG